MLGKKQQNEGKVNFKEQEWLILSLMTHTKKRRGKKSSFSLQSSFKFLSITFMAVSWHKCPILKPVPWVVLEVN